MVVGDVTVDDEDPQAAARPSNTAEIASERPARRRRRASSAAITEHERQGQLTGTTAGTLKNAAIRPGWAGRGKCPTGVGFRDAPSPLARRL
jgi:hypothetical protein